MSYLQHVLRDAPEPGEERTDGRKGRRAGGLLKREFCMNRLEVLSDSAIPKKIVRESIARA
eukprot:2132428-Pyramimonas_sp.AAC.1